VSLRQQASAVKTESALDVRHFTPDGPPPSSRAATRALPPGLREAAPRRIRYRVRLTWGDPPRGSREELLEFGNPLKVLDLLRRVAATPERPLHAVKLEVSVRPRWCEVPPGYVEWRAAQAVRRAEIREILERRAAERSARAASQPGAAR